MPLHAASLESLLVFAAIVAISALSNWLKQRKHQQELEAENRRAPFPRPGAAPPRQPGAPVPLPQEERPTAKPIDWQEELRRLLEGEPIERPRSPLPESSRPAEVPAPPPPLLVPPVRPEPAVPGIPSPRGTQFRKAVERLDQMEAPSFQLAPLTEAARAYERGSQLPQEAAGRLHHAVEHTQAVVLSSARLPSDRRPAPEVERVLAQLRDPRTARQAILASLIFSPPRALEHQP